MKSFKWRLRVRTFLTKTFVKCIPENIFANVRQNALHIHAYEQVRSITENAVEEFS